MTAIHKVAFPGFFLTVLGERFLCELYLGFLHDPSSICLVGEDEDALQLAGFVVGTVEPRGFFRRLLIRRWYAFIFAGISELLRHPLKVAGRFLDAIRYRGEVPGELVAAALLSSIAVAPSSAGRGFGALLVERFCQRAAARGALAVYLLTDAHCNDVVNKFYARCGFSLEGSFARRDGRRMNRYVRQLGPEVAAAAADVP